MTAQTPAANGGRVLDPNDPWFSTLLLGGLTLFVGLLAGAVWWGTMRTAKTKSKVGRAAGAG